MVNVAGPGSKRAVLSAGFGAMIVVLALSAGEAYHIQTSLSLQNLEIYRRYVAQDSAVATLRRNSWLAGNYLRDFLVYSTPGGAEMLRTQLQDLKEENADALAFLERSITPHDFLPGMQKSMNQFWAVAERTPETMLHQSSERKYEFIQREIVPLRGELYSALLDLTAGYQQRLQESERQFNETRRIAAQRLMMMLGLGLLLSFGVAGFSLRHAANLERRAQRHFSDVENARGELQQLSARLLEIEEEGRRRLSRELHDEIGQTLALLQIEISHAQTALSSQPGRVRERLERARTLAERTVQTIRNIALLLRPALLDDLGLVPALQFQLEDFQRRSGIACEFIEEGVAEQLPDAVKTCAYRVIQEALHNCEKHSSATKVRVSVHQVGAWLVATIEDNGQGFAINPQGMPDQRTGLGLLGIRERAAIAGGTLTIDSQPGHGTRITLRVPLAGGSVPVSETALEMKA
jgi:signal transduction histidine kinase